MADSPQLEDAARTLLKEGNALYAQGRSEEAKALYDQLIERFGSSTELALREHVAAALLNKGRSVYLVNRVAVFDQLIERFGAAPELYLRELVAMAQFEKGE